MARMVSVIISGTKGMTFEEITEIVIAAAENLEKEIVLIDKLRANKPLTKKIYQILDELQIKVEN